MTNSVLRNVVKIWEANIKIKLLPEYKADASNFYQEYNALLQIS